MGQGRVHEWLGALLQKDPVVGHGVEICGVLRVGGACRVSGIRAPVHLFECAREFRLRFNGGAFGVGFFAVLERVAGDGAASRAASGSDRTSSIPNTAVSFEVSRIRSDATPL